MSRPFHFKQFSIFQKDSPFKVGTDGVLLGAWAGQNLRPKNTLDIGTGTGLICLMLAQRFPLAQHNAIEINQAAFLQAQENVQASPWSDCITLEHGAIQQYGSTKAFDLIVCNPPYFTDSLKTKNPDSNFARHDDSLSLQELTENVRKFLAENGAFASILPYTKKSQIIQEASKVGLHPSRITDVRPTPTSDFKRCLIEFKSDDSEAIIDELVIETSRHVYSTEFIELAKDFYLKL